MATGATIFNNATRSHRGPVFGVAGVGYEGWGIEVALLVFPGRHDHMDDL